MRLFLLILILIIKIIIWVLRNYLPVYLSTCLRTYLCDKRSSDDVPHDLVGALKDLVHTYVTHVPLHLVVVQVPVAVWEVVMLHV